ncbi:MAG: hypothetical protein AB9879_11970 [Methanothrix sp.]|jgi:hypothetical protein
MTERLITARRQDCCGVRLLAEFKKRNAERKGGKKEEIKSKKLLEENLDDLRGRGEEEK